MVRQQTNRSKFSALALVQDHYDTLRNYQTGRPSPADYVVYLGTPALAAVASWSLDGRARNIPDVLTAVAVLTGLIFSVFVLIFDLTARAADTLEAESRELINRLADELRANVSYAVLVGIALTVVLGDIALFMDTDKPLGRIPTVLIVFGSVHLLLTIFMVLKRVRAMFRGFRLRQPERVP